MMKIKIEEIADLVNGKIIGNKDLEISQLSNIQDAKPGDLTFLYLSKIQSSSLTQQKPQQF